jgi:hypothetical protein
MWRHWVFEGRTAITAPSQNITRLASKGLGKGVSPNNFGATAPAPFQPAAHFAEKFFRLVCSGTKGIPIARALFWQVVMLRFKAADPPAGVPPAATIATGPVALRLYSSVLIKIGALSILNQLPPCRIRSNRRALWSYSQKFSTRTLMQIVVLLTATVAMKALTVHYDFSWATALAAGRWKMKEAAN